MEPDVYRGRRDRLLKQIADGVLLARGAAPAGASRNLFYLSGIDEPRAALLLAPAGVRIEMGREHPGPDYQRGRLARQVLFLPAADELAARWGEDAAATLGSLDPATAGVDAVLDAGELEGILAAALTADPVLHYVRSAAPSLAGGANPDTAFVERVRRELFGVRVEDASPLVHEMRRLKDAAEVRAIERSIAVTGEALTGAMRAARDGMREHEVEAEIARVYRAHGGVHAFDPIVGAGSNATLLHYMKNAGRVARGQLVLIDTGVCIDGYCSDITRAFPVDGKFTERQRGIYETVLRAEQEAIASCKPGALLGDIHARAFDVIDAAGYGRFFVHGTSHHLGLETHDVGDVHRPLEAGAVITVEPGIYIAEEQIGVRIEDDVLVTADGARILSEDIPRSVEGIERLLAGEPG